MTRGEQLLMAAAAYGDQMETARRERDRLIREAHEAGVSYRAIAARAGVSFQRVAQIVTNGKEER